MDGRFTDEVDDEKRDRESNADCGIERNGSYAWNADAF